MTVQSPIALVTGAGTGIGKACAHALVQNGYHVIFTGRRVEVLQQAITELKELAIQATPYALDISKVDQVQGLFQMITERFGRLDVLFNNARDDLKMLANYLAVNLKFDVIMPQQNMN